MITASDVKSLIRFLNYHTNKYNEGNTEIPDQLWDAMYFQLQKAEEDTGIIYPDSPTQRIDYVIQPKLNKYVHTHPMLSQKKTKSIDEIINFVDGRSYTAMCKMDGLSVSLRYEDGNLVSAATRGNGEIGENITHNAKVIPSIPIHIALKGIVVVDGEIIIDKVDFEDNFAEEYKNSRNFASGSIRLLNNSECAKRYLQFIAWDLIQGSDTDWFPERLCILDSLGFQVVPFISNIDTSFEDRIEQLKYEAENYAYPIDGIIVRFNDISYGQSLGATGHHFNHSIAYKFADEEYETTLLDIEYEPSRNGILTPVAIFNPIVIEGRTISRASLHNLSIMKELAGEEIHKGDKLMIYLANMIIPQIQTWENCGDGEVIHIPETCPYCGEKTRLNESDTGTVNLRCPNLSCGSRLSNQINHFVGKTGLDIKGISKTTIEKLIDWDWINSKKDIFTLCNHREEWIKKSGFGCKSVDKILEAIEESKTKVSLVQFISSLGISLIGINVSKEIAKRVKSYEELRQLIDNNFDFSEWPNFGLEMSKALKSYDWTEADYIFNEIFGHSLENNIIINSAMLNLNHIAITGKLNYGSREKFKQLIESLGGKVVSSINSKTTCLIANKPEDSVKYHSAQDYNIPILTESEFFEKYHINI